jgi:protein-disulfide isomerase
MSLEERLKFAAMKARHPNISRAWYKKWWGVLILIILGLILIILVFSGLYVSNKIKQIQLGQGETSLEQQRQNYLNAINGDGSNYYLGAAQAPVTIIEFGDFACHFCEQSVAGAKKLTAAYPDKVKIVWRDYPTIGPNSIILALAARCAGEQGKFWDFHDILFANQKELSAATSSDEFGSRLDSLAENLKLNITQFDDCLANSKYLDQVSQDHQAGETLGIKGTPTWFINNYSPISGSISEDKFMELAAGLLK